VKALHTLLNTGLMALAALAALAAAPGIAQAQNASNCAWTLTLSPFGTGNYLAPDDLARYWAVPFPKAYRTMRIQGRFPNARYFSFVVYDGDAAGRPLATAGSRNDTTITPDSTGPGATFTVNVSRDAGLAGGVNGIPVAANDAWVVLRIYVPAPDPTLSGHAASGSVPLPTLTLDNGAPLVACPVPSAVDGQAWHPVRSANKLEDLRAFMQLLFPSGFDINQPLDFDQFVTGRLWFAPPRVPPMLLFPNPDNKYVLATPGLYQKGRALVIRARAPTTAGDAAGPGRGRSAGHTQRAEPELRYWSLCNNDFALPIPSVRCVSDVDAKVEGGYFTIVVSDDVVRPEWLRPGLNWLPWGDPQFPKLLFFRHLMASEGFKYSAQQVSKGCPASCAHPEAVFDFTLPDLPRRATIDAAGPAVQRLMGEYYPVSAWCDKSVLERGGWQACLRR
jgi:hypothetical protein